MRIANYIRPRTSLSATADLASYCRIPELDPAMMIKNVDIRWDSNTEFLSGLYGAVSMHRKGNVSIGFLYTSTPATGGTFFKEPYISVMTISAGYYSGGSLTLHSIPLSGCQQRAMSLATVDHGNGAFTLEGTVSYSFASSDEDQNLITIGGSGNNSTRRPWYHARPA